MNRLLDRATAPATDGLPRTISHRTRRVYDHVAGVYPLSTMFFHSRAHEVALNLSGLRDGMTVLEVATGSGEMFRRIVRANRRGVTCGLDLSPNMAARTQGRVRREFPEASTLCKAVDARYLPFRDETFDSLFCCYLLELLAAEDICRTLQEFHRVLRPRGTFTLVLIGQNTDVFNRLYRVCNKVAPAFWGRQVEQRAADWIEAADFEIVREREVRQTGYPSRVLVARR